MEVWFHGSNSWTGLFKRTQFGGGGGLRMTRVVGGAYCQFYWVYV